MKIMKNDEAVSPVIGTILMVAITVILAAVIAAFVFGMVGTTSTTRTVGTTLSLNSTEPNWFHLQFTGGNDLPALVSIKVSRDGAPVPLETGDVVSPGYGTENLTITNNAITLKNDNKFQVGQVLMIDAGGSVSGHKITILGTFTDGGQQILWDRTL